MFYCGIDLVFSVGGGIFFLTLALAFLTQPEEGGDGLTNAREAVGFLQLGLALDGVTGEWKCFEAVVGNRLAGNLAEAVIAVVDLFQCGIDLEKGIAFLGE